MCCLMGTLPSLHYVLKVSTLRQPSSGGNCQYPRTTFSSRLWEAAFQLRGVNCAAALQMSADNGQIHVFFYIEAETRLTYVLTAYEGEVYVLNQHWASAGDDQDGLSSKVRFTSALMPLPCWTMAVEVWPCIQEEPAFAPRLCICLQHGVGMGLGGGGDLQTGRPDHQYQQPSESEVDKAVEIGCGTLNRKLPMHPHDHCIEKSVSAYPLTESHRTAMPICNPTRLLIAGNETTDKAQIAFTLVQGSIHSAPEQNQGPFWLHLGASLNGDYTPCDERFRGLDATKE